VEYKIMIHQACDSVGVAVADLSAGETARGIVAADGSTVEIKVRTDIPLPHKVAVKPVAQGENIIIYGWPCGFATQPIAPGDHVHVHNMASARW